ncbi:DEAD/DEAH box helicase family protein [Adlercreutzia caecimuris]|uniref:DEAD/DEAH box helicase family protein n=2 Tax=Adlercreutzia caecimuris TaxID=671266 RepID=UPI00272CB0A3|nr:DEAD/DEAH box helicase family protein [Adlercreutzia caecimuris]
MRLSDESRYEYSVIAFEDSLRASFIGSEKPSDDRHAPKIVMNDKGSATDVLSIIKNELADCTSFDFSVAFVTAGGIQVLVEALRLLEERGATGRILTSTYLNFNDPEALSKLLEFPAIDVRVYQGDLHAKGYFFNRETLSTFIIGSSNLTQTALTCNKEWNVLFRSFEGGEMLASARAEFERLWADEKSVELTREWILGYKRYLGEGSPESTRHVKRLKAFALKEVKAGVTADAPQGIVPNAMQERALEALRVQHELNEPRALLVSATGTGKTYLSALDVRQAKPGKVLFIAHRKRILKASVESYRRVLGDSYTYGVYGEDASFRAKTCGFAMVGALSKHLRDFDPCEYDYIVIDEAHRTGARSYRDILEYFRPKFFLGMTATPTRTDGYDVYRLFNHVIAYRITLQDALNENMLVPFHYFGIADLAIEDEETDDFALFGQLTSEERVRHVTEKVEEYTVSKADRRGLVFCSRNDEAKVLSSFSTSAGIEPLRFRGRRRISRETELLSGSKTGSCSTYSRWIS